MSISTKIYDGGPAFPESCNGQIVPGMSLRDWFAGQALASLAATYPVAFLEDDSTNLKHIAALKNRAAAAYAIADAMLNERDRTGGGR